MVNKTSYLSLFRLTFVFFSLYLMGDAFFRWDGFSYYASFSEFLPSIALASILWSIAAFLTTLAAWLLLRACDWLCKVAGLKFNSEHILFCAGIFLLSGLMVWKGKRLIWPDAETTRAIKIAVLVCIAFTSIFLTVLFRNRIERWLRVVHDRINPLVWMFGMFVILSIPLVAYYTFGSDRDDKAHNQSSGPAKSEIEKPDIILITFDSLAALKMSLYGYNKDTTPFINEWAKQATVFAKVEAESNFTTSSTASLMTGKRVWTHRTFQIEGTPVKSNTESLPAVLKRNGYYNMAFVVNPHTSVEILGMADSFDIAPNAAEFIEPSSLVGWPFGYLDVFLYRVFGNKIRLYNWILKNDFILRTLLLRISSDFTRTTVSPEMAFNYFLKSIDDIHQRPFFAWIHIFPPHDPYLPPEPFTDAAKLRSFKSQENIKIRSYKYLFDYLPFPAEMQPEVNLLKNNYDDFIRYCDYTFNNFIAGLKSRELDNTIIILSADHGESFEHGYFTHGGPFLYEQVTHIPLIIKQPGQIRGKVVSSRVEQIDIPATTLDLVDIPSPAWMEGRSLVPLMLGEDVPELPAFSMNFEENRSRGHQIITGSVAVWKGDYKLIHYLEREESLLFNLKEDPGELNNHFNEEPEIVQNLLGLIQWNLEKANQRIITSH